MKKNTETVEGYMKTVPAWAKPSLVAMRRAIRSVSPKLVESISYHMPYYSYHGRVCYLGVAKAHTSFFWISSTDKKEFKKDLANLPAPAGKPAGAGPVVVGNTLRVPQGAKPPLALIKKIVKTRIKRNEAAKAAKTTAVGRLKK